MITFDHWLHRSKRDPDFEAAWAHYEGCISSEALDRAYAKKLKGSERSAFELRAGYRWPWLCPQRVVRLLRAVRTEAPVMGDADRLLRDMRALHALGLVDEGLTRAGHEVLWYLTRVYV